MVQTNADVDKIEGPDIAAELEAEIARAMMIAADTYAQTGVPTVPIDHEANIRDILSKLWLGVITVEATAISDQFKGALPQIETKASMEFFLKLVEEYIVQWGGRKIAQIAETTRKQVMSLVSSGMKDGLSVAEIAKDIRTSIPEISRIRSNVISRTETHSSAQYGSLGAARESRVPLVKMWNSVEDHRTRNFVDGDKFSHRLMDGKKVGIDAAFLVPNKYGTSEELMFPGDPNGSAANTISCRCALTYEVNWQF